jgi:hypothetical protein
MCFNGEEFERPIKTKNCTCTESDWECDVGFYRMEEGTCVAKKK